MNIDEPSTGSSQYEGKSKPIYNSIIQSQNDFFVDLYVELKKNKLFR